CLLPPWSSLDESRQKILRALFPPFPIRQCSLRRYVSARRPSASLPLCPAPFQYSLSFARFAHTRRLCLQSCRPVPLPSCQIWKSCFPPAPHASTRRSVPMAHRLKCSLGSTVSPLPPRYRGVRQHAKLKELWHRPDTLQPNSLLETE